jgi:signal transduction histidine kinase/ActR/RegA family two-component response regulator
MNIKEGVSMESDKNSMKAFKDNFSKVLFIFSAFALLVSISFVYIFKTTNEFVYKNGATASNNVEVGIEGNLSDSKAIFQSFNIALSNHLSKYGNLNDLQYMFNHYIELFPENDIKYSDCIGFFALIDNEKIYSDKISPDRFLPEKLSNVNDWYIGAITSESDVYISHNEYMENGKPVEIITFSQAIYDEKNNALMAVVGADFTINAISTYVQNFTSELDERYALLINENDIIIACREGDHIGMTFSDYSKDYKQNKTTDIPSVKLSSFTDVHGGESIGFEKEILFDWKVVVTVPHDNYFNSVHTMLAVIVLLAISLATILSIIIVSLTGSKRRSDNSAQNRMEFLSSMSHELRTPINAIIGMTAIAKDETDPAKITNCLDNVNSASNHLLGIINDVLDINKITAGKFELSETNFKMSALITQIKNVISFKIAEKSQNFKIIVANDVPNAIHSDFQRITQVIINLLSNANKFTPSGGNISLEIKKIPNQTEEISENNSHHTHKNSHNEQLPQPQTEPKITLQFSVTDSGIGISEEQQAKRFHAFEQGDNTIHRRFGGTGLGLTISRQIVEMLGGQVAVSSQVGKGSTFTFTIQTVETTDIDTSDNVKEYSKDDIQDIFKGKKLLLAEDMEVNRIILETLLEPTGIEIIDAVDGKDAVAKFEENDFDLIFMDVHMPEMNGYDATRQIRKSPKPTAQTVPIIAMTASIFKEDIEACLQSGMNDHIGKPINIAQVIAKMTTYLDS